MKRRSFLKGSLWATLFGSTALVAKKDAGGFIVRGDVAKKLREPNQAIYDSIGTPNDPARATKYISGLYRSSTVMSENSVDMGDFGNGDIISFVSEKRQVFKDHYVISGEGKTLEHAWITFWMDYNSKTDNARPLPNKDIFWRRTVEEISFIDYDGRRLGGDGLDKQTIYRVGCRFSLGDFT